VVVKNAAMTVAETVADAVEKEEVPVVVTVVVAEVAVVADNLMQLVTCNIV
jgi:hypothetical protein